MSEHESIKKTVTQLNHNKSNIVTAVKTFVNSTKDLGQKTKDKGIAEKILITAQGSEKYAAANIPDLIIPGGPTPLVGSVKIHHPSNNSQHLFDTDIKLEFETKHVHLPFAYVVMGRDTSGEFFIKADISHNDKVLIHKIKKNDKDRLSVGVYEITVHIIDPTTKEDIVPPDKIVIEITPRAIGPGTNTVELKSPLAALSPYKTSEIPIQFKVDGPYHSTPKEYIYGVLVRNSTTKIPLAPIYDRAKDKEITHANSLKLADGVYEIQIKIIEPSSTMSEISHSDIVTFVVDTRTGPVPPGPVGPTNTIINNIIVNNNINIFNMNVPPLLMPINIEIVPNLTYIKEVITQPISIRISVTKEGSSTVIQTLNEIFEGVDLKQTLKRGIIFQEEGKYNLFIILHRDGKLLFRKIVPIEIKKKASRTRNDPVLSVEVDDKGSNDTESELGSKEGTHKVTITNVGGGRMGWRLHYPFYVDIVGTTKKMTEGRLEGILEGGKSTEIQFRYNKQYDTNMTLIRLIRDSKVSDTIQINATNDGHKGGDAGHHKIHLNFK